MNPENPSKLFSRFLRWFCKEDLYESIQGDLLEQYETDEASRGKFKAGLRYRLAILQFLKPKILKPFEGSKNLNYYGMLKHHILVSIRGFKRRKVIFLINLLGLSTGIATFFIISLWVENERSVDTFHENDEQLYRAITNFQLPQQIFTWDYTTGRLAESMKADFPEVEDAVRIGNSYFRPRGVISVDEQYFETEGLYAGKNFFQMMTFPLILGQTDQVLNSKESVAISESMAIKAFGSPEQAIGESLEWENGTFQKTLFVTGVFEDVPKNSRLKFDAVVNYDLLIEADNHADAWNGGYAETYLQLREGTDIALFNEKIARYYDEKAELDKFTLFVQKYSDQYLHNKYEDGVLVGGRIEQVRLFIVVAIFVLVIACINFMNLSTAQSSLRLKEISLKKVIGSNRPHLVAQFLSESVLMTTIAVAVGLGLTGLFLPWFNALIGAELEMGLTQYIPELLIFVIGFGLLAGLYPAFYLSGIRPILVVKGGQSSGSKGEVIIRKGLVIVQYTLTTLFLIGVIIVNQQIDFTQNQQLGYDRNNVLTFVRKGPDVNDPHPFLAELNQIPGVLKSANMAGDFLWGEDSGSGYNWNGDPLNNEHLFKSPKIGYNVIETLGLELVAGRSFDKDMGDDRSKIMLNESAVKMMGLEEPIGYQIKNGNQTKEVIGVVKDFQYGSLHQEIEPLLFRFRDWGRNYLVKIQPGAEIETLGAIEKVYKSFDPKYQMESSFLAQDYDELYSAEYKVASLANYMSAIAMIISCLGLFGMAMFSIQRKVKEIGIRKVLGCSVTSMVIRLSSEFTKMVVIAIVISIPLSYYFGNQWLGNFAYHITIEWWYYGVAGIGALLIALITIGSETIKAALANPVDALRSE